MVNGFFPTPYPDECYYSILCRYFARAGSISYKRTTTELFKNMQCLSSTIFFPTRLECLDDWLPPNSLITRRGFVLNNTMYPYMAMMYSPDFRAEMECIMNDGTPAFVLNRIGETKSLPLWPKYLKYCPECVREDNILYGEPYWHRAHQLFGVAYCTKHFTRILCSDILTSQTTTNFYPASNAELLDVAPSCDDDLELFKNKFLKLGKESEWLLKHGLNIDWSTNGYEKYRRLLRDRKLSTIQGVCNYEEISKAFASYWGEGFLSVLRLETADSRDWLGQIQEAKMRTFKSLYHIMLMCFLSDTVKNFVEHEASENPFGDEPLPCENPVCKQYRTNVCRNTEVKFQNGVATGFFRCDHCGMLYKQVKRMKGDGEPIVVEYGQLWVNELKRCLATKKMTESEVAEVLKCEIHIVHFQRKKLGLLRVEEYIRKPKRYDDTEPKAAETLYKSQVQDLIKKHGEVTFIMLRQYASGAYSYLWKNDRAWLQSHLIHESDRQHMKAADQQLLKQVQDAVEWVKSKGDTDKRLALGYIASVSGVKEHELKYAKQKRPLTKAYLDEVVESKENWLRRRITAIRMLKGDIISIIDIKYNMRLKPNTYRKYQNFIGELIEELNKSLQ